MTELQRIAIFAINNFGSGDHPFASEQSLEFFQASYVAACLKRAIRSPKISDAARDLAKQALAHYAK